MNNILSEVAEGAWHDVRNSSFFVGNRNIESATWLLDVRSLVKGIGGELSEQPKRLTATTVEELAKFFDDYPTDEGSNLLSVTFGEEYYLLPDGSYCGYTLSLVEEAFTTRIVRYAANYRTQSGAQPQYDAFPYNATDTPIGYSAKLPS